MIYSFRVWGDRHSRSIDAGDTARRARFWLRTTVVEYRGSLAVVVLRAAPVPAKPSLVARCGVECGDAMGWALTLTDC